MDDSGVILLVEDNPDDVELTLAALGENQPIPEVVANDGEEALDYLYRRGSTSRGPRPTPGWCSSTPSFPKWTGWRC